MAVRKTRPKPKPALSHLDDAARPRMVDVSAKRVSLRVAHAQCLVVLPPAAATALRGGGLRTRKGPVFDTAIVAGTMAVKRTHELIPFCHPLALESCEFTLEFDDPCTIAIRCRVVVRGRTGVEMEALTGATVAALTVYDMCKALSHRIVIGPACLLEKRGGRSGAWSADA